MAGQPETWEEAATKIALEIATMLRAKQLDYGYDNINAFGELGVLIRANDKISRLKNLIYKGKEPENEKIEDSWRDLAGYAIIALMLRAGTFNLPLNKEGDASDK